MSYEWPDRVRERGDEGVGDGEERKGGERKRRKEREDGGKREKHLVKREGRRG